MSRIRDKLKLLHKPISTPRPDVENFPSDGDPEPVPTPSRLDAVAAPVSLSAEMRARLDRLMKVSGAESRVPKVRARATRDEPAKPRHTSASPSPIAPVQPSAPPDPPDPPIRTNGGFTVSRRAFERWRKERVRGELPSAVVVRNKVEVMRELDVVSARSSSSTGIRQQQQRYKPETPRGPRSSSRVRATSTTLIADDPLVSVVSVEPQSELDSGDRRYYDTVARLAHLSADQAIRQVLDALEMGVSRSVKVHAFRTLAKLSEETGSSQFAIAAYDSLSTLCPDDPLPHRELYRLYSRQPDGLRRARFHVARAAELAPWDGELQRLHSKMRSVDASDEETPFDS